MENSISGLHRDNEKENGNYRDWMLLVARLETWSSHKFAGSFFPAPLQSDHQRFGCMVS